MTPEPDDDGSLYRLFGFALFVGISFRKKAVLGCLRKKFTILERNSYRVQLKVLKSLLENDKSCLPACVKFQDRGKMMFPHRKLLPFCRVFSLGIKTYLNPFMYNLLGRKVIQVNINIMCMCLVKAYILKQKVQRSNPLSFLYMYTRFLTTPTCRGTCSKAFNSESR